MIFFPLFHHAEYPGHQRLFVLTSKFHCSSLLLHRLVHTVPLIDFLLHEDQHQIIRQGSHVVCQRVGFVFEKSCIFQQNHTAVRKKRHRLRKVNHFGNLGSFSLKAGEIHRVVLRQQCVFQLVFILMLQIGFFSVEQVGLLKILRFDIF